MRQLTHFNVRVPRDNGAGDSTSSYTIGPFDHIDGANRIAHQRGLQGRDAGVEEVYYLTDNLHIGYRMPTVPVLVNIPPVHEISKILNKLSTHELNVILAMFRQ